MRNNALLTMACILQAIAFIPDALASAGDKRSILTSGEKVHTIRYQLGQSTILYFGMKPETVICGNKNYFAIEKIKEGVTIQPLGNFSTNLTVLNRGRRFLFYLTPAKGAAPDTFIDVKWVSPDEMVPLPPPNRKSDQSIKTLSKRIRAGDVELTLLREIRNASTKRSILELKNMSNRFISVADLQILLTSRGKPLLRQTVVFEQDGVSAMAKVKGRMIVTNSDLKGALLMVSRKRGSDQTQVKVSLY